MLSFFSKWSFPYSISDHVVGHSWAVSPRLGPGFLSRGQRACWKTAAGESSSAILVITAGPCRTPNITALRVDTHPQGTLPPPRAEYTLLPISTLPPPNQRRCLRNEKRTELQVLCSHFWLLSSRSIVPRRGRENVGMQTRGDAD